MAIRGYPRLSIEEFGHELLRSQDIDPVYSTLNAMDWNEAQRDRWLLAYWLCYHIGASCWLSEQEGDDYWVALTTAAYNEQATPLGANTRWPRAPERRHWRGKAAVHSMLELGKKYETASDMVMYCAGGEDGWSTPEPYRNVLYRVKRHYNFGDWIAYKIGDMLERCCGVPVEFTRDDAMYATPTQAALKLWVMKAGLAEGAKPKDEKAAVGQVVDYLLDLFKDYEAPGGGRSVGLTEIETVLCKWMSHMHGHYPVHNDLIEIRAGYEPWRAVSATARQFSERFPKVPG